MAGKSGKSTVGLGNKMPEQAKHIRSSYDAAPYGLRNDVLMMSSLTDRILQTAFEAFLTRNSELCDQVVAEDEDIDTIGEKLVARATADPENVPSYLDLIFVGRALERIGDHATNIAEDSFWRDQATDIRHTQARNELPMF